MPPRQDILAKLREQGETLADRYRTMPVDELLAPCTESEAPGAGPWCPKDHLAHLVHVERLAHGIVERTLAGAPNPIGFSGSSMDEILAGVHRMNEDTVTRFRETSLDELLPELASVRRETIAVAERT